MADQRAVLGAKINIAIIAGRALKPMDGGGLFGKAKTADPFVKVICCGKELGRTKAVDKCLDPAWNETLEFQLEGKLFRPSGELVLAVFDKDKFSDDDPMGEVRLPMQQLLSGHVREGWHSVQNCAGQKKATGELQLKVSVLARRAISLAPHDSVAITDSTIAVGFGWDPLPGGVAIDLDTSCIALDAKGGLLMEETVYFARLHNPSNSIRHTGDETDGAEDLGQGDDEIIVVDLHRVPAQVHALFFVGTVASEGRTFADVKSSRIRLCEWGTGTERCRFMPAMAGAHTAVFMGRVAREGKGWRLTAIGESDHTARDWGSVVPELRSYMADLVPGIKVDPNERVAVMRKGGVIRVKDYCPSPQLPQTLVIGLAWDITDGVAIDLDASVICLDAQLRQLDLIFFGKLQSNDGAIRHGGDQRSGAAKGDDEQVFLNLAKVHPQVAYIGFVVNSYSGQELDDVAGASCHLFDGGTGRDVATFTLSNTKFLDKHTALVMGMLYRDAASGDWCFRIISEAAQGRTAHDNVDELQRFIQKTPPPTLATARTHLPAGAGEAMLGRWRQGLAEGRDVPLGVPAYEQVVQGSVVPMGSAV